MELAEALKIVVDRTGHERYRELTDPTHPDYDPGYVTTVMTIAAGMAGVSSPAPSLLAKAANFTRAVVQHVGAGMPTADDATVAGRLVICNSCDKYDRESTSCQLCGCNMPWKARWLEQACPIGKW